MWLKTTTRAWRNTEFIQRTVWHIDSTSPKHIAIVGPGGILLFPYLTHTPENETQKVIRFFVHQIESLLRKTRLFDLQQFEAQEIYQTLEKQCIPLASVCVVDIEHAVLEAVQKVLWKNWIMHYQQHDITLWSLNSQQRYDAIFCYNVLQRTTDPLGSLNNLIRSLAPQWILSLVSTDELLQEIRKEGKLVEIEPNLFTLTWL